MSIPSNYYGTTSDFDKVKSDMFTARFEHDLTPNVTLRNTTRYGQDVAGLHADGLHGRRSANIVTPSAANPAGWTLAARSNPTNKDQVNKIFTNQTNVQRASSTPAASATRSTPASS